MMGNTDTVSVFETVPLAARTRMLRHTTHLPGTLRPAHRRKKALVAGGDVARAGREAVEAQLHAEAVMYPARERAAGGPQDRALYGCTCGYAFHAPVEAGVHCPQCRAEQSW